MLGDFVAEAGGSHLGYGEASGGDDDGGGVEGGVGGFDFELRAVVGDGEDAGAELEGDAGLGALVGEEVDDIVGGPIAEELSQGLFMPGDLVLVD